MNFQEANNDFKKRYERSANKIYFVGKPLIFLRDAQRVMGCATSIGGAILVAPRKDGRLCLEFSNSADFFTSNVNELKHNQDNSVFEILQRLRDTGVELGGADILFYYNTGLLAPKLPMIIAALSSFCKNVPKESEVIRHFEDFQKHTVCLQSKKDCITIFDGKNAEYVHLPDSMVKIVISKIKDKRSMKIAESKEIDSAISAAGCLDLEKLGRILNKSAEDTIRKNKKTQTVELFNVAKSQGYALGSGFFGDGGIFSIVENKLVDSFMQNLASYYGRYFGQRPDFYVTNTAFSGIEIAPIEFGSDG